MEMLTFGIKEFWVLFLMLWVVIRKYKSLVPQGNIWESVQNMPRNRSTKGAGSEVLIYHLLPPFGWGLFLEQGNYPVCWASLTRFLPPCRTRTTQRARTYKTYLSMRLSRCPHPARKQRHRRCITKSWRTVDDTKAVFSVWTFPGTVWNFPSIESGMKVFLKADNAL